MLTALEDEYTQVLSLDEQADDYITKPFSMVLLGKRITALLRRSGREVLIDTMTFNDVTVDFSGYGAKYPLYSDFRLLCKPFAESPVVSRPCSFYLGQLNSSPSSVAVHLHTGVIFYSCT